MTRQERTELKELDRKHNELIGMRGRAIQLLKDIDKEIEDLGLEAIAKCGRSGHAWTRISDPSGGADGYTRCDRCGVDEVEYRKQMGITP